MHVGGGGGGGYVYIVVRMLGAPLYNNTPACSIQQTAASHRIDCFIWSRHTPNHIHNFSFNWSDVVNILSQQK